VAELVREGVWLGLLESEPEADGEAPTDREALGLLDTVLLTLPDTVEAPVPVPDTVALWLGVWLALPVPEEVQLGLAPALRVPGADGLWLELWLLLLVGDPVAVPLPDAVPVGELLRLPVPVTVLLSELLLLPEALAVMLLEAELLGLAPTERELVGLTLIEELALRVEEGVGPAEPVPVLLGVPEEEALGVAGGVELPDRELLLDVEAEAPGDRLEVALALTVELELTVVEGVRAGVPVLL
jgi:hypothetical protein